MSTPAPASTGPAPVWEELMACPACSVPPGLLLIPDIVQGRRSGRWFIMAASGCSHTPQFNPDCVGDDPAALATKWNAWVRQRVCSRAASLGLDEEGAARLLADHREAARDEALRRYRMREP